MLNQSILAKVEGMGGCRACRRWIAGFRELESERDSGVRVSIVSNFEQKLNLKWLPFSLRGKRSHATWLLKGCMLMKRVIDFFGSIRLAIFLLITLTFVSVFGVIIPQDLAASQYIQAWGVIAGKLILFTGINHLFSTIWFHLLLIILSINIFVCSYLRIFKKLKTIHSPHFLKTHADIEHIPNARTFLVNVQAEIAEKTILKVLAGKLFKCAVEQRDGLIQIYAGKGGLKIIGSLAFHLSLIMLLIGGLIGRMAGFSYNENIPQGAAVPVRDQDFMVRCDWFKLEKNPRGEIKAFVSKLTILDNDSTELLTKEIRVNHPLSFRNINFYQSSYGIDGNGAEQVQLMVTGPGILVGFEIAVQLGETIEIPGTGISLNAETFLSDFVMDMNTRQPYSRSTEPNNPAVKVSLSKDGNLVYSHWIFLKHQDYHASDGEFRASLKDFTPSYFTGLKIRKDPGSPLIWIGIILMSLGLYAMFFLSRKNIWIALSPGSESGLQVTIGSSGGHGSDNENELLIGKIKSKLEKT